LPGALVCFALLFGLGFSFGQLAPPAKDAKDAKDAKEGAESWLSLLKDEKLSDQEIAAAAALALRAQADDKTPWNVHWGDFIELARTKGRISDDLWRDYLLGAVRFNIHLPVSTKRSAGLPIWVTQERGRTGSKVVPAKVMGDRQEDLSGIAVASRKRGGKHWMNLSPVAASGTGWTEDLTQERYSGLKPGPQVYHYIYTIQAIEDQPGQAGGARILGEKKLEGSIAWQLLDDNSPDLVPELKPDETLRAAVASSIRVNYILRDVNDKTLIQTMVQVDLSPADMAFDAALRVDGEDWPLGPVAWSKGDRGWWAFDADLPENIQQAQVVLVPSVKAATRLAADPAVHPIHRLTEMRAVWGGPELVMPVTEIHPQAIRMHKIAPPAPAVALQYALDQMNASDPLVQKLSRDKDIAAAAAELQRRLKTRPDDAAARFRLGCILTADRKMVEAMAQFVEARRQTHDASLSRALQRQQRRLCAMWLNLAEAKNADAAAMTALGQAYEHGWGVTQVIDEAKRWYRNGSNAGNAEAMCRIAAMYEKKTGATVPTENADRWYADQALEWYRKSANLGNEEAKQWLLKNDHPNPQ